MKLRFVLGDAYTRLLASRQHSIAPAMSIIRQICRARPDGYQYMPRFKAGNWDGYISLLKNGLIPTGAMRYVVDELEAQGYQCVYSYSQLCHRVDASEPSDDMLDGTILRDYQMDAVRTLLAKGRGIAKMATNAGKTLVAAALIKALGNANAMVLVRSKDLLYQTSSRLAGYLGRSVGIIGDQQRSDDDVVVATIQTLQSMRKMDETTYGKRAGRQEFERRFYGNRVLIIDECHHVGNNRTFDILMDITGWHRYGMSGTPLDRGQLNDSKLIACTGPVQVDVSNRQMIENGWSARPYIIVSEVPDRTDGCWAGDMSGEMAWDTSYQLAYDDFIIHHPERNAFIVEDAKAEFDNGSSILVIVTRIEHGNILADAMLDSGIMATFVNGGSPMDQRMMALDSLNNGPSCVIATNIFDEGVDVPALDVVILACGGNSHINLLQRIGRGLRCKDGDNVMRVYDYLDGQNEYLVNHMEERLNVYKQEGFETEYVELVDE